MKNRFLLTACAVALLAAVFTSCREKTDFDAIVDQVSTQTLKGYFSGAKATEQVSMALLQYYFADDGTVERTEMTLGDGLYKAPQTRKFSSWKFGQFKNQNVAREIILIPADGGEPFVVELYLGGIYESNELPLAADKNDKVKEVVPTQDAIIGKVWYANDTVYHKIDTVINVIKYDTTYTYKPKKDPVTGKNMKDEEGHVIYEQTIKSISQTEVPTKMKFAIAPKTINVRILELNRDPETLENTGKWYMISKAYNMSAKREITLVTDTAAAFEFRWCFAEFSSSSAFEIMARKSDSTDELFELKYDSKIPAITVDKQVLKVFE